MRAGHRILSTLSSSGGPRNGRPKSHSRTAPLRPAAPGATLASSRPPALLVSESREHAHLPRSDRPPLRSPGGGGHSRRDAGGRHSLCYSSDAQAEGAGAPAVMCLSLQLPRARVHGNTGSPGPGLLFGGPTASFPAGTPTPVQVEWSRAVAATLDPISAVPDDDASETVGRSGAVSKSTWYNMFY